MIIVNLKGGLGNQMFQYACGRALTLRQQEKSGKGVNLKLDITGYSKNNSKNAVRRYSLSPFDIRAEIATPEEVRELKRPYGMFSTCWNFFKVKILRRFNMDFRQKIFNAVGSVYLEGFFQTEKYFLDCIDTIRRDFSLKKPMGKTGQTMADVIAKEPESVSLHVRCGDVARDAATNPYADICTPKYYRAALDYIGARFDQPHVFIFSDDPRWVVENIKIPFPSTVVSGAGIPDYEEIILMSRCRAHIIANSSFSWWGAWLDSHLDKIVIAPKQWVKKAQWRHKDTVPKSWIRI